MKKIGCLNAQLSGVIARLGHFDTLAIGDCGLPIPPNCERVDLAVTHGVPSFWDVFGVIDAEACFQKVTLASEAASANPEFRERVLAWAEKNDIEVEEIPHDDFKRRLPACRAVVRTGECRPFSNLILESNVSF